MISKLDHAGLLKGGCKVAPEDVLKTLAAGKEKITLLDVRTQAEAKVVAQSHPVALHTPMDKLFKPENLARLPKDGRIYVTVIPITARRRLRPCSTPSISATSPTSTAA